ncbi:MAG: NapC/NirT family cytochrome c [bacterium]
MSDEEEGRQTGRGFPRLVYNPVSLVGAAVAASMVLVILFLFILDSVSDQSSPYLGVLGFAVLPVPLILGLLAIPFGMWMEWRREKKMGPRERDLPVVDMNRHDHRRALVTFLVGTIIFLFLTAGGSYKAYEYSESVEFCGTFCHTVMEPEYVTYQNSPHARVKCVECHIGGGAEWFVRSKISGSYQFYSVTFDKYPRPIPTPIEDLRPARETCERCHWPAKFHGDQLWEVDRYLSDEENTRWKIRMVMRTGGADEFNQRTRGIHWHIAQEVEYVASDSTRQEIQEVRHHLPDGTVKVYQNTWNPLPGDTAVDEDLVRVMDCMDCHNRPSHQYLSPRHAMDQALETGSVPADLPYIKREAATLLAAEYESREEGLASIADELRDFYAANYPDVMSSRQAALLKGIEGVKEVFNTFFFPYMKARWDAYPVNIGHQEYPGCFRCHNGAFQSAEGETISAGCQLCHAILSQGPGTPDMQAQGTEGVEFRHPVDIGEAWRELACSDCHTGGGY